MKYYPIIMQSFLVVLYLIMTLVGLLQYATYSIITPFSILGTCGIFGIPFGLLFFFTLQQVQIKEDVIIFKFLFVKRCYYYKDIVKVKVYEKTKSFNIDFLGGGSINLSGYYWSFKLFVDLKKKLINANVLFEK